MEYVAKDVIFEGQTTQFWVSNPADHIQGHHSRNQFYEINQLIAQRDLIPMHGIVLDVGANIGNHTLFYAKNTYAKEIYPFEPNGEARELLLRNIESNSSLRGNINLSYVNNAVGGNNISLSLESSPVNNLGGARFVPASTTASQSIACKRLDDLNFSGPVSFIKIDVEGMELDVLHGADNVIQEERPSIAIEINSKQEVAFWDWLEKRKYHVVRAFFDYAYFKNYLLIPKS